MTEPFGDEPETAKDELFEVYNTDQTVGVGCNRGGSVVAVHISDDILDHGDHWVGQEIMRVAKLAHMKSRVGLRKQMERSGTDAYTLSSFGLPSETDYLAAEIAEFGGNGHRPG